MPVLSRTKGRPGLIAAIHTAILAHGPLTFAAFMELALYHPRFGYYSTLRAAPGARGDYVTSPETHPVFGALLARQALDVWARLDRPHPFHVEEWGAGSGRLAADLLRTAPLLDPELAMNTSYTIVERSEALVRVQRRLLRPWAGRVRWVAAADSGAPDLVLAHELLDAFPVHRVRRRDSTLRELYVDRTADGFCETEGDPSTPALAAHFARLGLLPPEGAVVEVNLAACEWVRGVAARLTRGAVMVIDYGHPAEVLYSPGNAAGRLRTYFRQGVGADPFARIGWQDLTTDVDLTSVLLEGRATGLEPLGIARQRDFLHRLGLEGFTEAVRGAALPVATARASLAGLAALAQPGGLGDHWVLGLGRGLTGPLHGLDERARPLPAIAAARLLHPRLGWGDRDVISPTAGASRGAYGRSGRTAPRARTEGCR